MIACLDIKDRTEFVTFIAFFFGRVHLGHLEVARLEIELKLQLLDLSSWILVGFITTEPQWKFLHFYNIDSGIFIDRASR